MRLQIDCIDRRVPRGFIKYFRYNNLFKFKCQAIPFLIFEIKDLKINDLCVIYAIVAPNVTE